MQWIALIASIENSIELFDIISSRGAFDEQESAKVIYNILLAIEGLHLLGVVHRDIKVTPELLCQSFSLTNRLKILCREFTIRAN